MVNLNCNLMASRITIETSFLACEDSSRFNWGGKTHPESGRRHPIGWGPRLHKKGEKPVECVLSPGSASWMWMNVTNCLKLLYCDFPTRTDGTLQQRTPSNPSLSFFCWVCCCSNKTSKWFLKLHLNFVVSISSHSILFSVSSFFKVVSNLKSVCLHVSAVVCVWRVE